MNKLSIRALQSDLKKYDRIYDDTYKYGKWIVNTMPDGMNTIFTIEVDDQTYAGYMPNQDILKMTKKELEQFINETVFYGSPLESEQ